MVKRGRKLFVTCPANARHKQRQGLHTSAVTDGLVGGQREVVAWTGLTAFAEAEAAWMVARRAAAAAASSGVVVVGADGLIDDDL